MREDFTLALSGLLAGVEHVFLNCELWPCRFFAKNNNIEILLHKRDLSQTLASLKASLLVEDIITSSKYRVTKVIAILENGEKVGLDFWHKLSQDAIIYMDEEAIFAARIQQNSGIYIPCIEHHFEYTILKNYLIYQGITDREFRYFNDFHVLVKEDLIEFFNLKYGTIFNKLYQLTEYIPAQRIAILKKLKQEPMNQFFRTFNLRWANFIGKTVTPNNRHQI